MEYSSERKAPRISVGIPLYRSLKFLPILENNLRALGDEPLEIMISDRHLHDNAIDLLEKTFGEDSRIRFLRSRDGIGWAEHFNFMLREARGDFFLWMPHDDDFPEGFVQKLAAELERKPEAVIAYGQMRPIDRSGRSLWMPPLPDRKSVV